MPIAFVSGDLFTDPSLDALAHGCNCAGAMGKGIALQFKRRFPAMYSEYRRRCAAGQFSLGDVFEWNANSILVFNLATQRTWRTKADLWAVEAAVSRMTTRATDLGIHRVGLPRIAAGLGGLDWAGQVRPLLQQIGDNAKVHLEVFETFVSAGKTPPG